MILHLSKSTDAKLVEEIVDNYDAFHILQEDKHVVITSSSVKEVDEKYQDAITESFVFKTDIQLASNEYLSSNREIHFGDISIGGNTNNSVMITGPCSVESEEQINEVGQFVSDMGIKIIRGGCYKPRTSPYSFQGLGLKGVKLLRDVADKFNLKIITEVRDATHVDEVIEHTDIIQVGAKAMYDHGILNACSKASKPVLLKRGFGSSLQEFVQAAEFILSGGNSDVILCERGIRTFETKTRFTLDLCGVAYLKEHTNLPIILDPSHAIGYSYGVPDLSRACLAMGVDGLLIETHPNPKVAKSDAAQQLTFKEYRDLYNSLKPIAEAVGRNIV